MGSEVTGFSHSEPTDCVQKSRCGNDNCPMLEFFAFCRPKDSVRTAWVARIGSFEFRSRDGRKKATFASRQLLSSSSIQAVMCYSRGLREE
jgi:hypothetical protein